jgi:hypothetical protein
MRRTTWVNGSWVLVLALGVLAAACKSAEFQGAAPQKQSEKDKNEPGEDDDDVPATDDDKPVVPGSDIPQVTTTTPGDQGDVTTGVDDGSNPGLDTGVDDGATTPWLDIIGGLIRTITDVEITRPENNDNEIVIGETKMFHIGDDNFDQSSECARRINTYPLSGKRYFFEFEVTQADTRVEVGINKICGIDYQETDHLFIVGPTGAQLDTKALPRGTEKAAFDGRVLQPGKYRLIAETRPAGSENPQVPNDHDDFIVGQIHIKADKPIKPGIVGAE